MEIDEQISEEPVNEVEETPKDDEEVKESIDMNEKELNYFKNKSIIEIGKINFKNSSNQQHYFRGSMISPDGTCILSAVNAKGMYIFDLPQDLYSAKEISNEREINILKPVITIKTISNLYDMCFNPLLNSQYPDTCYWISSSQNEPIKMFDAYNGNYKCCYRVYDYADELEAALSCQFSTDGLNIFAGMKKSIAVFDTAVPGRDYDTIQIKQPISSIATNFDSTLAAGSWNKQITLIDTRDYLTIDTLHGHKQGITFLKYSVNGQNLISGSRKDSNLLYWDLRNTSLPLYRFTRRVDNNQKIYFDISYNSNYLISGDTRGIVHVWNLSDLNEDGFPKEDQYQLHSDSCSGISMHPYLPILVTSSGQFKFDNEYDESEVEKEIVENSMVIWWIGDTKNEDE